MLPLAGAFRVSNPTALLTIYNTAFDNNTDGFKFGYSSAYHHSFSASFNSSASLNNLGININNGFNSSNKVFPLFYNSKNFVPTGTVEDDSVPSPRKLLVFKNDRILEPLQEYNLTGPVKSIIS